MGSSFVRRSFVVRTFVRTSFVRSFVRTFVRTSFVRSFVRTSFVVRSFVRSVHENYRKIKTPIIGCFYFTLQSHMTYIFITTAALAFIS